jgi:predicted RNA methylase
MIVDRRLVGLAEEDLIVEPSAGGGAFVRAALRRPGQIVLPIDIDPEAACHRLEVASMLGARSVVGDFLTTERPDMDIGAIIGNPPFPDGRTARRHVLHALSWRPQVCCLVLPVEYLGHTSWQTVMYGETHGMRLTMVEAIVPRPWPANVRETFAYTWRPVDGAVVRTLGEPLVWA